jgi:HK97 family phage major capsid protein
VRTVEEIQALMQAIVDAADTEERSLSDDEISNYESLEKELKMVAKTSEIRSRNAAYNMPHVQANPITGNAKGDEVLERAFDHYLRTGQANQDIVELRAQSTTDAAGGYTIPAGFRNKLTEVKEAVGGVMNLAEHITTDSGNTLEWPTNDDTANDGAITDESSAVASGADLVFGTVNLGAFKYTSAGTGSNLPLRVSVELLQDSAFDVASLVGRKLGERIYRAQAADFASGAGTTEPLGIQTTTHNVLDGGTTLTYDKLVDTYFSLDAYYRDNATWVMNDSTFAELTKLVDGSQRPLIQMSAEAGAGGAPVQAILGKRIVVDNNFVTTSGYNYVVFGDINQSYIIRDVKDVTIVVNPYNRASYGEVEYHGWARADGTIQNRSAFVTVKSDRVA